MPDITMCIGRDCPKKHTCYRHTAFPKEHWQSYFIGVPYKGEGCEYYWKMEEHDYERSVEDRSRHRDGSISQEDPLGSN